MGFEVGQINTLDPFTGMITLFLVIVFILFFKWLTGILEYCVQGSLIYNRMIQKIYKELMQMGLISFTVICFEAQSGEKEGKIKEWTTSINFVHVLLFCLALFFVLHSLYLIAISFSISRHYLKFHGYNTLLLLQSKNQMNWMQTILFDAVFLPELIGSQLRKQMEYKLLHILFKDTFRGMPANFNFPIYLDKCFKRHVLNAVDISIMSWMVIAILSAINYIRVRFHGSFNCRSHAEISFVEAENSSTMACEDHNIALFILMLFLIIIYFIIVLFTARLYELRLVCLCYVYSRHAPFSNSDSAHPPKDLPSLSPPLHLLPWTEYMSPSPFPITRLTSFIFQFTV
jgi:hypothetical protein